jgi:hypothetical protein
MNTEKTKVGVPAKVRVSGTLVYCDAEGREIKRVKLTGQVPLEPQDPETPPESGPVNDVL